MLLNADSLKTHEKPRRSIDDADPDHVVHPKKRLKPGYTRIKMLLSYDGTDFCGWQRQTNLITVQGTVESALTQIFNEPVSLMGSSRTDSGVHALGQVAHFDAPREPKGFDLRYALQGRLPPSIVIRDCWIAPDDFHSIACCEKKTYQYLVLNRRTPSALRYRYTHWIRYPLDIDFLNAASQTFLGKHDFKSFQSAGTKLLSTEREIYSAHWERKDNDTIAFTVTGNGFLKQMIRNMVGTLIEMNQRSEPIEKVQKILQAKDRRVAGATAPPQGLYLSRVYYPESLDNKCRKL